MESDVCAEQIKTFDQCRLKQYLGNVGSEVMKRVDGVLIISFGIEENDLVNIENVEEKRGT